MRPLVLLLVLLVLLVVIPARAQQSPVIPAATIVDALDRPVLVPKGLSPKSARIRAREIRRIDVGPIQFRFDSTELDGEHSREQVRQLGLALAHPRLSSAVVSLVGHASADGPADHNLDLSKRRAEAIRDLLIYEHRIAADRLLADGKGASEPLPDLPPEAAENRRVEVIREE